ncbi:MAG: permease-like cell division protein FtsX [Bacteroidales bacterium]|nr:permease-like cell division protein FtsX [Bacteroidales bacterium]
MSRKEESRIIRRRLRNAYASSIISISMVLLLVGIASLLIVNARAVSDYFKENMQLSVILKTDTTPEEAEAYGKSIGTLPYIKGFRIVSREEGTRELAGMLGEDFLSVFEETPVPMSLNVTLRADYVAADSIPLVRRALSASPVVDEVEWQQSLVEALTENLARISLVLGVFILLLLFVSFVLINNTVRLSVYSRRFTIHTMQLVGATRGFIRAPFVRGAVFQGLAASVLSLLVLTGVLYLLYREFPQIVTSIQPVSYAIAAGVVVVAGVLICVVSTWLVVGRLITLNKDELYY